jgi:hypothetical protein
MVDIKTAQPGSHANRPPRSISQIVVLHIPHSSRRVPAEERQAILVDDTELNGELLRMTDAYTDELFPITPVEAGRVIFPLSRLVCDVERFPSDETEPMAAREWVSLTLVHRWAECFERSRIQRIVKSAWTGGIGRTIRSWSTW